MEANVMELKQPNILLVEDVKIAQKMAILLFTQLNCLIDTASTAMEALEQVASNKYDLILMDLGLPDMDGITLTEKIRASFITLKNTPIVALTSHSGTAHKQPCFDSGMNDFIEKPLTLENSKYILNRWLSC